MLAAQCLMRRNRHRIARFKAARWQESAEVTHRSGSAWGTPPLLTHEEKHGYRRSAEKHLLDPAAVPSLLLGTRALHQDDPFWGGLPAPGFDHPGGPDAARLRGDGLR